MAKKSKKMQDALKKVDTTKAYSVEEAVALAKEVNFAKFDATVEVAYKLSVDPKKADQQIRGAVVLPNGTGKTQTVLVIFINNDVGWAAHRKRNTITVHFRDLDIAAADRYTSDRHF